MCVLYTDMGRYLCISLPRKENSFLGLDPLCMYTGSAMTRSKRLSQKRYAIKVDVKFVNAKLHMKGFQCKKVLMIGHKNISWSHYISVQRFPQNLPTFLK
jgi:hypothetical protein